MKPRFTDEDVAYLSEEAERLRIAWTKTGILALALKHCRGTVLGAHASRDVVAKAAVSSLLQRKPFSMVRVGDGEGNVLSLLEESSNYRLNLTAFNCVFHLQALRCLSVDEARSFSRTMESAVCGADILGVRSLNPWDVSSFDSLELHTVGKCLEKRNIRGAHGLIHARKQIERLLAAGRLSDAILTQAWVHMSLLPNLDDIVEACQRLIVITGRNALANEFRSRFSSKGLQFMLIPLEGQRPAKNGAPAHFPCTYTEILERLDDDLSGTLVLVGAGIFGKAYCHAAKKSGAVALDMGSAFDILCGLKTRPVHDPNFIQEVRWLDPHSQKLETNTSRLQS